MLRHRAARLRTLLTLCACFAPVELTAQTNYTGIGGLNQVSVASETETYLRYMDLTDTTSSASWTLRPLSPPQIRALASRLTNDPWSSHLRGFESSHKRFELGFLSPSLSVRFNSQFPYGSNDGPIWAGRGLTTAIQGGAYARIGSLSLTLLPIAFSAQNTAFPLGASTLPCGCGDPQFSTVIDRPQRFGNAPYHRLDPGESTVRLDAFGFTAGASTATQWWGPTFEYPFVLGNNAPGIPNIFFGTSAPLPIFIGRAQLRVMYGRLDQSEFSPVTGSKFYSSLLEGGRLRFASGLVITFQPRGFDGLELGGARFIHSIWPSTGIPASYLKKPLQAFLKVNQPGIDQQIGATDNQLASAFARWAFRQSGVEVYAEYGREDHAYDKRDLVQEPDHSRAYSVGVAKVIRGGSDRTFSVLRGELISFLLPPLATTKRGEGGIYIHSLTRQGHTNRGQLLGADVGVGSAAGSTLRWDHYSPGGRWALFWRRDVQAELADPNLDGPTVPQLSDVLHAFGFERLKATRHFDITTSLILMRDLNRNFTLSRFNANAVVAITIPR